MSESMNQPMSTPEAPGAAAGHEQMEILDQLLKPEVQQSLTTLVEQLPKLTELVTILTKSYDLVQALATDDVLKNDTVGAIQEVVEPVKDTVKSLASAAIEAKDRADASHEVIGLFGLLKMIKDPQVQKLFRFLNAYLQITAEREKEKSFK